MISTATEKNTAERIAEIEPYLDAVFTFPWVEHPGERDPLLLLPKNFYDPELEACIRREMERCDVAKFNHTQMVAHLLPDPAPAPAMIVCHEVQTTTWFQYARNEPFFSKEKWLSFYRGLRSFHLESTWCPRFDLVLALCEEDRTTLRRLAPKSQVAVTHLGVDLSHYTAPVSRSPSGEILYVGNYHHPPNTDAACHLVLEIMPRVWNHFPEARVILAGASPTPEVLALQGDRVEVTGRVPELVPYYQRADIFAAPIREGRGVRGKMLEAMACGCPVVATALASAGLGAVDGEDLLNAEGAVPFSDAILSLLSDSNQRSELSRNAKTLSSRFSWEEIALQYETQLYETIRLAQGRLS